LAEVDALLSLAEAVSVGVGRALAVGAELLATLTTFNTGFHWVYKWVYIPCAARPVVQEEEVRL
jgi:hypothetical protein